MKTDIFCVSSESECDCVNGFIMEATFFDSNFLFANVTFVCMYDLQSTMWYDDLERQIYCFQRISESWSTRLIRTLRACVCMCICVNFGLSISFLSLLLPLRCHRFQFSFSNLYVVIIVVSLFPISPNRTWKPSLLPNKKTHTNHFKLNA